MVSVSANFRHIGILSRHCGCGRRQDSDRIRNVTMPDYFAGTGTPAIFTGTLPTVLRLVK